MLPSVCCILLANGREAMARRAIKSFHSQTYPNRYLLIFDTTPAGQLPLTADDFGATVGQMWGPKPGYTIGHLRNEAIDCVECGIIAHWDSDDWSHPNRLAEQVALLQSNPQVQVTGYRDMLFWRETVIMQPEKMSAEALQAGAAAEVVGESWLYQDVRKSYCVGSSLCYWRSAWEQKSFPDLPKMGIDARGEDDTWHKAFHSAGESSQGIEFTKEPRMICSIHGGNTSDYSRGHLMNSPQWKRVPGWDDHCRKVMQL